MTILVINDTYYNDRVKKYKSNQVQTDAMGSRTMARIPTDSVLSEFFIAYRIKVCTGQFDNFNLQSSSATSQEC